MSSFLVNSFALIARKLSEIRLNTCACNSKPTPVEGGSFLDQNAWKSETPSGYQGHIQNMDTYPYLFHVLYTRYIKVYHRGLNIHAKYSTTLVQKRARI